jgi:hypothetical protein
VFNGVYLLTSIGLNITKSTKYYPVATAIAAGTSVGGNLVLVRYGAIGAAWANAIAYAVMAMVAMRFSQRAYPVTYEWGRLARLAIAGGGAFAIAWLVPDVMPAWLGLLVRGSIVVAAYPLLLVAPGFCDRRELALVGRVVTRARRRAGEPPVHVVTHEEALESAGAIVEVPLEQGNDQPRPSVTDQHSCPEPSSWHRSVAPTES